MNQSNTPDRPMTVDELAAAIGAKQPSIKRALDELGIIGRRDISDRRRIVYPIGTLAKVQAWLEAH